MSEKQSDTPTGEIDQIRSPKEAAVEMWEEALDDLPDGAEWAETLRNADIHNWSDRWEIEEIIDQEVPKEHHTPLEDAFHDLQMAFDGWWS